MTEGQAILVLTRKENESIIMTGGIRVTVLWIGEGRVKLGIDAPQTIAIHRNELVEPEAELGGEG